MQTEASGYGMSPTKPNFNRSETMLTGLHPLHGIPMATFSRRVPKMNASNTTEGWNVGSLKHTLVPLHPYPFPTMDSFLPHGRLTNQFGSGGSETGRR